MGMSPGFGRVRRAAAMGAVLGGIVLTASACTVSVRGDGRAPTSSAPVAAVAAPRSSRTDGCIPAAVLPARCGTSTATWIGRAYGGGRGGRPSTPLQTSFAVRAGRLVLLARGGHCFTAEVPMRVAPRTLPGGSAQPVLLRAGAPRFGTGGCETADRAGWTRRFLDTDLRTSDGEVFFHGKDADVFFQYDGIAPLGAPRWPRTESTCVAAHVEPFGCATWRSTGGSGDLAFLAVRPFRLDFRHLNGELTAGLYGACNGQSVGLEVDGATVVASGGSSTAMLCPGTRGDDDGRVARFFTGVLGWRLHGDVLTVTGPAGSATFAR